MYEDDTFLKWNFATEFKTVARLYHVKIFCDDRGHNIKIVTTKYKKAENVFIFVGNRNAVVRVMLRSIIVVIGNVVGKNGITTIGGQVGHRCPRISLNLIPGPVLAGARALVYRRHIAADVSIHRHRWRSRRYIDGGATRSSAIVARSKGTGPKKIECRRRATASVRSRPSRRRVRRRGRPLSRQSLVRLLAHVLAGLVETTTVSPRWSVPIRARFACARQIIRPFFFSPAKNNANRSVGSARAC